MADGKAGKLLAVAIRAVPSSEKKSEGGPVAEKAKPEKDETPEGLETAMAKLSAALKEGDTKAAAKAFKTAQGICSAYEE